jgi:hypothetical protein
MADHTDNDNVLQMPASVLDRMLFKVRPALEARAKSHRAAATGAELIENLGKRDPRSIAGREQPKLADDPLFVSLTGGIMYLLEESPFRATQILAVIDETWTWLKIVRGKHCDRPTKDLAVRVSEMMTGAGYDDTGEFLIDLVHEPDWNRIHFADTKEEVIAQLHARFDVKTLSLAEDLAAMVEDRVACHPPTYRRPWTYFEEWLDVVSLICAARAESNRIGDQ